MKHAALLLLLATAACSSGSPTVSAPSPTVAPTPTSSSSASPAATATPTATVAAGTLVLETDGLGVLTGGTHIDHFPFSGTNAAQIEAIVARLYGRGATTAQPECGQGPRSSYRAKGISLLLHGRTWVGWSSTQKGVTTADGIGAGVTRAAVESSGTAVTFSQTTLGTEFMTADGGFGGVMTGPKRTDTVSTAYAGETCFFR